jgi:hypothetical protein
VQSVLRLADIRRGADHVDVTSSPAMGVEVGVVGQRR